MEKYKAYINVGVIVSIALFSLSACSRLGLSQQNSGVGAVNEELVIPPGLKAAGSKATRPTRKIAGRMVQTNQRRPGTAVKSGRNYYVVVGTYPDYKQALDTFVRLSSIGLPGATMESRKTKAGKNLHMVRLGPYQKQADIDKVKDSLTSDGLSQFKVVEN